MSDSFAIQRGESPATTIRQLVDAQRQNFAGAGADLYSLRLILDRAHISAYYSADSQSTTVVFDGDDWQEFKDALDRLERNLTKANAKATLAFEAVSKT